MLWLIPKLCTYILHAHQHGRLCVPLVREIQHGQFAISIATKFYPNKLITWLCWLLSLMIKQRLSQFEFYAVLWHLVSVSINVYKLRLYIKEFQHTNTLTYHLSVPVARPQWSSVQALNETFEVGPCNTCSQKSPAMSHRSLATSKGQGESTLNNSEWKEVTCSWSFKSFHLWGDCQHMCSNLTHNII